MDCQHDGCEKQATVHVSQVRDGEVSDEFHLCEQHAHEDGVYDISPPSSLSDLVASLRADEAEAEANECVHCGASWSTFQSSGRLGCSRCYLMFRDQLTALVDRIHSDEKHRGREPRAHPPQIEPSRRIQRLEEELAEAVAAEDFELAAKLRDRIKDLKDAPD
jgi:protein arginine kinase activator